MRFAFRRITYIVRSSRRCFLHACRAFAAGFYNSLADVARQRVPRRCTRVRMLPALPLWFLRRRCSFLGMFCLPADSIDGRIRVLPCVAFARIKLSPPCQRALPLYISGDG